MLEYPNSNFYPDPDPDPKDNRIIGMLRAAGGNPGELDQSSVPSGTWWKEYVLLGSELSDINTGSPEKDPFQIRRSTHSNSNPKPNPSLNPILDSEDHFPS